MLHLQSALGLVAIMALAWLISENRREASPIIALIGIALQITLGFLFLNIPFLREAMFAIGGLVEGLQNATRAGTSLVFGYLGGSEDTPFEVTNIGATFIFAFQALPIVLVVSALTTLLTFWGIMQRIVQVFAIALEKTLNVGGAVGLAAAANIFVGMIEAPLFIRAYLSRLTRSELFMVMCTGMATIAGTVLALYAAILSDQIPGIAGHLIVASIISAPAAIAIAKLMVPETEDPTEGRFMPHPESTSSMDAITRGTQAGLQLYLNIIAMLIVLVSLVAIVNSMIGLLPAIGGEPLTLQRLLGWLVSPLCWLMGVPWAEATTAGALLGTKTVLNEFVAYLDLAKTPPEALSERSRLIMAYALCGFANLGSLGILIGGLVSISPERREEIVALGPKSIVGGTLATCATGAAVGLISFM
ncbi:MAG: NupC/NupG family nucleoside CNT transporter [Geminicoccaceae bacterium]